jgi:hypothetical protein
MEIPKAKRGKKDTLCGEGVNLYHCTGPKILLDIKGALI